MKLAHVILTMFAASLMAASPARAQRHDQTAPQQKRPPEERERLGVRAGFVGTTSTLKDNFGEGANLALHWITHIKQPVYVDFSLGSFYMGATHNQQPTFDLFGATYDRVSMRVIRFTVAPMLDFQINDKWNGYFSMGGGAYIVSLLLDEDFFGFDLTDTHFGIDLGGGFTRRFTENWFIDVHGEVHKFWSGSGPKNIFYIYSGNDQDPIFYQITAGLLVRLF